MTYVVGLVLYAILLLVMYRFFPNLLGAGAPPKPQDVSTLVQRAQAKEQEAKAPTLTSNERLSKLREAEQLYREIASKAPKSDAGINAEFQIARLYEQDKLAGDKETANLEQARNVYKQLVNSFDKNRTATITLDGRPQTVPVWETANNKLEGVLLRLDREHSKNPLYWIIDTLVRITGRVPGFSYWFAILLITVVVKSALYPLQKTSMVNMQKMAALQPKVKEIQERYKGRPAVETNQAIQNLYKESGVNIAGGCLPMLLQGAALIPLYWTFQHYEYQFRHGTFLWIGSALSYQYPNIIATSLAAFDVPLLVIYIISMFLQSKFMPMTAPSTDPEQAQQQKMMSYMMPAMFGVFMFFWKLPSAFTLYWLGLNVITVIQQAQIMKHTKALAPPVTPSLSVATA
ncbi:MAG: hypothetical protein C4321_10500, partial [Chloroflexota bacterium]